MQAVQSPVKEYQCPKCGKKCMSMWGHLFDGRMREVTYRSGFSSSRSCCADYFAITFQYVTSLSPSLLAPFNMGQSPCVHFLFSGILLESSESLNAFSRRSSICNFIHATNPAQQSSGYFCSCKNIYFANDVCFLNGLRAMLQTWM